MDSGSLRTGIAGASVIKGVSYENRNDAESLPGQKF